MKTILIANQKGGCGKTLVVDELAFSFDRTDVKYSLYDLDGQGGIIHEPKVIDDADYAIVDTPGYISDKVWCWSDNYVQSIRLSGCIR